MYNDYRMNDQNVKDYQKYERTIKTINKRFKTYGYERIKTPMFEQYDLYSQVKSSINKKEMIKIIDRTGEVAVLRPDVTVPITKQLADNYPKLPNDLRYYYVQDVFRQPSFEDGSIEGTQAGVEYFCETSPEADAEVIALACHTLKDLGFSEIKIEMGHAGFFTELIQMINLADHDVGQLKSLIQAKNIVEIEPFLRNFDIREDVIEALIKIPLLYGNPADVSERARNIVQTVKMDETLDYLLTVYEILKLYGLENNIVLDLGLINHMGYYSDVIFQGFVEKFGKPVLMGGRYNQLGDEFGADLPAIGFACEVESLVTALTTDTVSPRTPIDIKILYDDENLKESIRIANELRERNYTVLSYPIEKALSNVQNSIYQLTISSKNNVFKYREEQTSFQSLNELIKLLNGAKGAM
ncbi:ATP phosphoribosyltransferase regulatory subunit [Sporosarcina sp. Marseille-Q4063]|uniref:ATP phosphoribosyltransferase regulatory subunit n=1 Tax=Sporosarcina sp. Marseille-Q4063 TaxID=2810514 RepID=UPI001BB095DD|nr:ATP phosphoribosyltransferase regulatory subunit [Sporosarcina sp. Marseille-Q4063]QUW22863.1 ATP phosphoribosyltransferase regulatory subunit [Sporosarcina sp. Marseille-Q4063]